MAFSFVAVLYMSLKRFFLSQTFITFFLILDVLCDIVLLNFKVFKNMIMSSFYSVIAYLVKIARDRRVLHGTYRPNKQEEIGSRMTFDNELKQPPEEPLI